MFWLQCLHLQRLFLLKLWSASQKRQKQSAPMNFQEKHCQKPVPAKTELKSKELKLLLLFRLKKSVSRKPELPVSRNRILDSLDSLVRGCHVKTMPVDAVSKKKAATTTADALRGDTVVEGLDMPDVKKVSKDFMDGYFQVPKVLGEGA